MKKRCLALYVENNAGVLAKIADLFAGKNYNLNSLTVGVTSDASISRMTITLTSDDILFEQIKKQLNRCIEIIKVIDLSDSDVKIQELMFIKIVNCSEEDKKYIIELTKNFELKIYDMGSDYMLLELVGTCEQNDELILAVGKYKTAEIVRSGAVAIKL